MLLWRPSISGGWQVNFTIDGDGGEERSLLTPMLPFTSDLKPLVEYDEMALDAPWPCRCMC